MISEKDIKRFKHGDKDLRQLLRPELEKETINLNSWLPEYERYYDANPQDALIGTLVQKGREKLKILKGFLKQNLTEIGKKKW